MHSECSYCLSVHVCACLFVRTHACIQTEHTCLNGCITHENAAPEMYLRTCMYSYVRTSDLSLKIEEDVDGAIEMMAQTGPFSVPVRCRRKRCAVSGYLNVHTYIRTSCTCTHVHTQFDIIGIWGEHNRSISYHYKHVDVHTDICTFVLYYVSSTCGWVRWVNVV